MSGTDRLEAYHTFEDRIKKSLNCDCRYLVLDFVEERDFLFIFVDSIVGARIISHEYQKKAPGFKIKVVLLPDEGVGDMRRGLCHVGVAPVRRHHASASEQVTQLLYGESFDTLQIVDDWIRVRLHADGYLGWVAAKQVTLFDDKSFYEYDYTSKFVVCEKVVSLLEKPDATSPAVREAVMGTQVSVSGRSGKFLQVRTPDGTTAYIYESSVQYSRLQKEFSVANLIEDARSFLGISYVWGGRSTKGFDCSGFTQTVFRMNGIEIPRDADAQFTSGKYVGKKIKDLKTGDLLFFSSNGDKISHVGLYLGKNGRFIHSSGFVRINSFDRTRRDYDKKLRSRFVGACRVI